MTFDILIFLVGMQRNQRDAMGASRTQEKYKPLALPSFPVLPKNKDLSAVIF